MIIIRYRILVAKNNFFPLSDTHVLFQCRLISVAINITFTEIHSVTKRLQILIKAFT